MDKISPQIEASWKEILAGEFSQVYFQQLKAFLVKERKQYTIFPPGGKIFSAFDNTPFHEVKVVILGQDPYHGPGQAHGLCFSVPKGVAVPPSLQNVFKEIKDDLGAAIPDHGNLEKWAREGVLLLNATLTVRANMAGSHQKQGWERFTDKAIYKLASERDGIVFMLWGKYAQAKSDFIDPERHLILKAPHPSPLSARRGFFGCKHFSKANEYLTARGKVPVDWSL